MRYFRSATIAIWLLASLILLTTPAMAWDQNWSVRRWHNVPAVVTTAPECPECFPVAGIAPVTDDQPSYLVATRGRTARRRADLAGQHADKLARQFYYSQQRLAALATRLQRLVENHSHYMSAIPTNSSQNTQRPSRSMARIKRRLVRQQLSIAQTKLIAAKQAADESVRAFRAIMPGPLWEQREKSFAARDLAMQARENYRASRLTLLQAVRVLRA